MKRVEAIVKGRVQGVGYRDDVKEIARRLKITGSVENLKGYDVRIIAEGSDEDIDRFIEEIKIKKCPVDVERVDLHFEEFNGEFEYFEIKRGDWQDELGERLDAAATLLCRSVKLGEESVKIGRKMLDKQDETTGEIKNLREDLKTYMERRFGEIEDEIQLIKHTFFVDQVQ